MACCIAFIEYTVEVTSENYILGCCPQYVCQVSVEELFSFIPLARTRRGIYVYKPYSFEFCGDRSARWHSCYVRKLDVVSRNDSSTTPRRTYIVVHRVTVQVVEAGVGDFLQKSMSMSCLLIKLRNICILVVDVMPLIFSVAMFVVTMWRVRGVWPALNYLSLFDVAFLVLLLFRSAGGSPLPSSLSFFLVAAGCYVHPACLPFHLLGFV